MNYYIIANLSKENACECAIAAAEKLYLAGQGIFIDEQVFSGKLAGKANCMPHDEALKACDIVVAVGGDGTIIHSAVDARAFDKPIIGINSGRLGFLTQIEYPFGSQLDALITGDYTVQERMVLQAEIKSDGETKTAFAINDIVIARTSVGSMIDVEVIRNKKPFTEYRADGMILSTPTGSTAYSLSAGGAIVDPTIECIIMTPICPHSLRDRCVIINSEDKLDVRLLSKNTKPNANISIDGVVLTDILHWDMITVKKSTKPVKFIQLNENDFYKTLNNKFGNKN